ncbi:MAG: penicillin-binding protein 2 [Verrucomicrobia bacterium]|nr:penicillin-binding protein 2 [Verrucomicrobiota bacterium]
MIKTERARITLACAAVALVFTAFSWRLVHLHVAKHEDYARMAAEKHSMRQTIHAIRGFIYDRNGEILATNLPVRTVVADASHIKDPEKLAETASKHLAIPVPELLEKFATGRKYIVLKREVPEETAMALNREMQELKLRGIHFERDAIRYYPHGEMLGHVLGFLDHEGKGVQGIEMTLESELRGKDGHRFIERDRMGREIVPYRGLEQPAEDGRNIYLTVDLGLQSIVEGELDTAYRDLKPQSATAIMVDPKTGGILAMATRPAFDPNHPGGSKPEAMKNRAIIDIVEPGSTFKIVPIAGALNEGKVDGLSTIFCENGRFAYGGRTLKDHNGYGYLTVHDIMVKSSNIGCAKLAMLMGGDKFHEYVRAFGFGSRLGVELPGEVAGIVHPPARWDKLTITRMPMGHSVAVTPLQITMGMAVIANGGKLMKPTIVKSMASPDGKFVRENPPRVIRKVIPTTTASFVNESLVGVTQPGGTATYAQVNGFLVAGKTGTAQKVSPTGGYTPGKYVVSFAGYMPAEDPKFVCYVMIDDAQTAPGLNYGGLVAAPIFARISEKAARHLDLVPTLPAMPVATVSASAN